MGMRHLLLVAAFLAFPSMLAAGDNRTTSRAPEGRRSERRDQAAAQRKPLNTSAKITRSSSVRRQFQREHPCPATGKTTGACPGYVVDHIVPRKRGGADSPENLQWQTAADAKAKDRIE